LIQKYYKYRAFNKPEDEIKTTDNIIVNSSLYYASPSKFNDPFDCQLSFCETYSRKERKDYLEYLFRFGVC